MPLPMVLDLLPTLAIVDDDVAAVVEAYMVDPGVGLIAFGEGYRVDPAAAVSAHPFANALIGAPWASDELRRAAVRAAVMLARPEQSVVSASTVDPVGDFMSSSGRGGDDPNFHDPHASVS